MGGDSCQKTCDYNGYGSYSIPYVDYYGPYTTGVWEEYESFRKMAGFDGEVDGNVIYYDFEIMYENGLSYGPNVMVNGKVIYKSTAGADIYVVHGGDGGFGCYNGGYPGWMVVNPTLFEETIAHSYMEP